jgi:phosphatidylglycerophosphatase A
MNEPLKGRKPRSVIDYLSVAISTFGVGYIPGAPGTYGSLIGLGIYLFVGMYLAEAAEHGLRNGHLTAFIVAFHFSVIATALFLFVLAGIWAAGRVTEIFGTDDPHEAVVDEVMGQIIALLFIPFTTSWKWILAGFLLFRLFDIWKPYPIDTLQQLPRGLGVCADDILAGVYAGICLAVAYAVSLM